MYQKGLQLVLYWKMGWWGIDGDNSDIREGTFEANMYDLFRNRVEHTTSSLPRAASRRTQANSYSQTMNTIGGTGVNNGSRADVHNAMARPAGLREG